MPEKQVQELGRILTHLRDNAPQQPADDDSMMIDACEYDGSKEGGSSDDTLDDDHPYSDKWPEVFCNGQGVYSEQFYSKFQFLRGVDPFDEEARYRSSEAYLTSEIATDLPDRNAEVPPALAFVNSLISLELDDLPDEDQNCPICQERYREGEFEEMPLELPGCGHVVGKDCLLAWLSTFSSLKDGMLHNSCPHCRRETPVEHRMSIDTPAGLMQLLRDANYLLTRSGPLFLNRKSRHHWEVIKKYANDDLEERRLYDRDHALLEENRKMNERKVEIFMVLMKDHIAKYAQSISSPSTEKKGRCAEYLSNALRWFERRGLVEAYLNLKDGVDAEDGDLNLTVEAMNTELATLPYPLAALMEQTYSGTLA